MRLKPIFIMSPLPRSGTTALQRVFNAHPGVIIWGETRWPQILEDGLKWNETGAENHKRFRSGERDFWTAIMCPPRGRLIPAMRGFLVDAHAVAGCRWGIKMVRGGIGTVRLLVQLFPAARFLFLNRNPDDCIKSIKAQKWTGYSDDYRLLKSTWRTNSLNFNHYAKCNPTTAMRMDYDALDDASVMRKAFQMCGVPFDEKKFRAAIGLRIGATTT